MSLVLWYVDFNSDIQEDFISFVFCENGLTGKNLASVLIKKNWFPWPWNRNCRGQAYDGAGNVARPKGGLAVDITRLSSRALYMHWFNCRVNLSVAKTFKITSVHNLMDRIREITKFFNYSQEREQVLEKYVDLLNTLGISNSWPQNFLEF